MEGIESCQDNTGKSVGLASVEANLKDIFTNCLPRQS